MSATELYTQTLEQYKAALSGGRNVSLTVFCKEHHVNGRAMNKWLSSHGIYVVNLRKQLLPHSSAQQTKDRPTPMFEAIEMPNLVRTDGMTDVSIETSSGIKLTIGTCNASSLGHLLIQLTDHSSCSR